MKVTKLFTVALLSMSLLLTAACSGNVKETSGGEGSKEDVTTTDEDANNADDAEQDASDSVPSETPEEVVEEQSYDPNLDLGGYEYVIACFYGADVWHPEAGKSEMGDLLLARYKEIEEQNNCTIKFIDCTTDEFLDGINTSAASGVKYADQVHVNMDMYQKLMSADYLAPMSELPYINVEDEKWNQYYMGVTTNKEGKLFGLDFLSWPNRKPFPDQCVFFNKTLVKELGLSDPYEMYDKGEWTWENFRKLLLDSTRDTNGDNVNDIYGITCVGNLMEYAALYSNGAHTFDVVDGKYQFGLANDAAYKALQFTSDIRNVDQTFLSFPEDAHWGLPLDTFKAHGTVFFMRDVIYFQDLKDNEHEFGMLPFPKGPDLQGNYPTATWNADTQVQSILKIGTDVEKAAYIFNRITEPFDGYAVGDWEDYALRNHFMKDEKAFEIFKQMCANSVTDGFSIYGGDNHWKISQAINDTIKLVKTPAEAINSVKDELQTFLDENYN
ncbi:MAG: extracellular solute-binding protein family 1 [Herbinix sp.]|jgi:ABC-type glycerol-3-phosphate transport system substrate-binding protein|nr:extracellular solute-binding protein family 1 [Herbinix sp.]